MNWIQVKKSLPDEDALYLIYAPTADKQKPIITVAWYEPNGFGWSMLPEVWIKAITHWMKLPSAPKDSLN